MTLKKINIIVCDTYGTSGWQNINFVKALDLNFNSKKKRTECLMDYFGLCIMYITKGITSHHTIRTRPSELKILLMKVKEENEKAGLKHNIQKTKIMASGPIISWQIDGGTKMETMADFIFLGSKNTADSDFSQEIKRCLLLGRKAMTKLDSVLKGRDITLLTKVHIIKSMVFPVVMYGYDSCMALTHLKRP